MGLLKPICLNLSPPPPLLIGVFVNRKGGGGLKLGPIRPKCITVYQSKKNRKSLALWGLYALLHLLLLIGVFIKFIRGLDFF